MIYDNCSAGTKEPFGVQQNCLKEATDSRDGKAPAASKWLDSVTITSNCSGVFKIVLLLDHRALVPKVFWNTNLECQDTVQDMIVLNKITIRGGLAWSVNLHKLLPHGSANPKCL